MNQYQHYFLDEFVEDFQDGRLSRRDFILRAVAVSGGVAAAIGLLKSLGLTEADVAAAQAAPAAVVLNQANPVTVSPEARAPCDAGLVRYPEIRDARFGATRFSLEGLREMLVHVAGG